MSTARYLIRLDDACDTMDHRRWERIEQLLDSHGVKPIVAVIPANRDPTLRYDEADPSFWNKVRSWGAKGWTIAMHGYAHLMHPTGSPLVLPFYRRSEFAGLPLEEQCAKVRAGWALFEAQQLQPTVWVAPAHSFDLLTLEAVRRETPIAVISDGIAWDSYYEHGFHWIPQQLWSLTERRSGLWTVCLHPNTMDDAAMGALDRALQGPFRNRLTRVEALQLRRRKKTALGRLYHAYFWWRWKQAMQAT